MALTLPTILLIVALVCFIIAAIGSTFGRINFTAAGLAFCVASVLAGSNLLG